MEREKFIQIIAKQQLTREEFKLCREYYEESGEAKEGLLLYLACSLSYVCWLIGESESLGREESRIVFTAYTMVDEIQKKTIEKALFEKNTSLIYGTVKQFSNSNIEKEDLIQEAMYAFYKAVIHFDVDKECKFSTYAYKTVMLYLQKYVRRNESIISFPIRVYDEYVQLKTIKDVYLSRNPDAKEEEVLSYIAGITGKSISYIRNILNDPVFKQPVSLQMNNSEQEEDCSLEKKIPCHKSEDRFGEVINELYSREMMEYARNVLTINEYAVITKIFGLWGEEKLSRSEICSEIGKSQASVTLLKNSAIKKLRDIYMEKGIISA